MELNRNHYLTIGLVVLLLGVQLRVIESFVLNEKTAEVVGKYIHKPQEQSPPPMLFVAAAQSANPGHRLELPTWIGWAMIAVGGVLVLHSLAMRKPGG